MAKLCIETLHRSVWKIFGFQHEEAVADREFLLTEIGQNLGPKMASEIQHHVDVALGRIQADEGPNPHVTAMPEFFDLLAAEMAVREVADRISANAIFVDSDDGFLPTLGMSWKDDVLPLLDGQKSPGQMSVQNVQKFLEMVRNTEGSDETISDDVRKRRRELVAFLEKTVNLGEPLWCEL